MKVRKDFVTNSSSSSFIISKRCLDEDQIEAIREHYELGNKLGMVDPKWDSPWRIEENDDYITGYTSMDNFDMGSFLEKIDVNGANVSWSEYPISLQEINNDDETEENNDSEWRRLLHED